MSGLEASLLLGSAHSVLLAIALQRRAHNRRANRYLAAQLVALSLLLFDGFLRARGVLAAHPHLIGLTAWVPFVLAPLLFLYVREMTATDPAHLRPPWRHFIIPAAYVLMLVVTFYPRSASYKLGISRDASWFVRAIEIGLLVYGIGYCIAALAQLRHHRRHVQALYSNLQGVSLRWLMVLAVLNALVWIAALVSFVLRMTGATEGSASAIVPIGSTITVFVIGYFQLGQGEIFVGQPVIESPATDASSPAGASPTSSRTPATRSASPAAAATATLGGASEARTATPRGASTPPRDTSPPNVSATPAIASPPRSRHAAPDQMAGPASESAQLVAADPAAGSATESAQLVTAEPTAVPATESTAQLVAAEPTVGAPKPAQPYGRARLAEDDAAALEARVRAAMTERRLYQRAGLTLGELADDVSATPHEVSQILSTRLGRNFYTFVNEHRIEHVKAGLQGSDRPVLDLAFEAGFQSKSTFNSAFRKATGTTPREFRTRPGS